MTMKPRLLRSGLTGTVYVITRYTEDDKGNIVAQTKWDVTEDFKALRPPVEECLDPWDCCVHAPEDRYPDEFPSTSVEA